MIALAAFVAAALSCGAVPRPGVAVLGLDGQWHGSAVDACRHAARRLGRPGIRFHGYRTRAALVDSADDDIAFLSAAERSAAALPATIIAPAIASSIQLLVGKTPVLASGRPVLCFIVASAAEDALEAWLAARRRDAVLLGFQEPDEMADGLGSGKCAAMAIDGADQAAGDAVIATLATVPIDALTTTRNTTALAAALR